MTFPCVYRGMGVVLVEGPDEIQNEDPPNGKQTSLPEALLLMEYMYIADWKALCPLFNASNPDTHLEPH